MWGSPVRRTVRCLTWAGGGPRESQEGPTCQELCGVAAGTRQPGRDGQAASKGSIQSPPGEKGRVI